MTRRNFLRLASGVTVLACAPIYGQPRKMPRIGFITASELDLSLEPFRAGLGEHGYVEGRNIALEVRSALGKQDRLDGFAADLVRSNVDIIVAGGSDSVKAVQRATKKIPVVMTQTSDALGSGFIASLARPGGTTTGVTSFAGELGGKRLQLVRELVPGATRVAVTRDPANPSHQPGIDVLRRAALAMNITIDVFDFPAKSDLGPGLAAIARSRPDALLVLPDNMLVNQRAEVVRYAAQAKLPVIYWRKEFVEAGGLIAYGADNPAQYRRAAAYVDKILRGANPAELPVEQVSQYELFINVKAAREIGIRIPQSILVRADKVIQ